MMKSIEIEGKEYVYIVNENGESTVDGLLFSSEESIKSLVDYFSDVGGLSGDMFEPLQRGYTDKVVVLQYTIEYMGRLLKVLFYKDDEVEVSITFSGEYYNYLLKNVGEFGNKINSLLYIKEHDLVSYLQGYYNPKSKDDSGIYLNSEMVRGGETLRIMDMESFTSIEGDFFKNLGRIGIEEIEIKLFDKINSFGNIGYMRYKRNGKWLTSIENSYWNNKETLEFTEKEIEDLIEKMKLYIVEEIAYNCNSDFRWFGVEGVLKQSTKMYEEDIEGVCVDILSVRDFNYYLKNGHLTK